MKNLLTIAMVFLFFTNPIAANNVDSVALFSQAQIQISETQYLIKKLGRDKIAEQYFDQLKETQVALAQLKANPDIDKENAIEANINYFAIEDLLFPERSETNQLKRQSVNHRGSGSAIIRGVVSDALTEEVMDDLNIRLYDDLGNYIGSTRTDDQGRYIFSSLEAGDYAVLALTPFYSEYISTIYPQQECPGGLGSGCQIEDLTLLTVDDGEIIEDANIMVFVKPTVTGRVYDSEQPDVSLSHSRIKLYDEYMNIISSVNTDQFGRYKIASPETGHYYVVAEKYRYERQLFDGINCYPDCIFSQGTLLYLSSNSDTGNIDFALDGFSDITGTISDAESLSGLNAGRIYLFEENGYLVDSTTVYETNKWKFDSIASNQIYYIASESQGYLATMFIDKSCDSADVDSCEVTSGVQVGHSHGPTVDVDILMAKGASISGEVLSYDNERLSSVEIRVYDMNSNLVLRQISTDENGQYETKSLSDGQYYLVAQRYDYIDSLYPNISCENSACDFNLGSLVTIENGQNVSNINFQLNKFGQVSGQITNVPENSFRGRVYLRNEITDQIYIEHVFYDLNYQFDRVQSGSYQIFIVSDDYYPETHDDVRCHNQECTDVPYTAINVDENSAIEIDFSLSKYGQVEFELSSNSVNAVHSGSINIYDAVGEYYSYSNINNPVSLPEGDYYFQYIGSVSSHRNQFVSKVYGGGNCFDDCDITSGTLVHVDDNNVQTLTMTLDEYFYVSIDSNVYGSQYSVYNDDLSNYAQGYIYSNPKRQYIRDLNPKTIKVHDDGYFSQLYDGIDCLDQDCDLSMATEIMPQLNGSLVVEADLMPLTTLSGTVYSEDGSPLSNVIVSLLTNLNHNHSSYSVETNSNGEYEILAVAAGDYFIRARQSGYPLPASHSTTYYGDITCESNCADMEIPAVVLKGGDQLTGYNIQMSLRGTLSGEGILSVDGTPVNSYINIFRVDDNYLNHITQINVNSDGTIDEIHLPEGQYKLTVTTNTYPSLVTSFPSQVCGESQSNCADESEILTISNGENTHFNGFTVHQVGQLRGHITSDIPDLIINNASVNFYKLGSGLYDSTTYTNNGYYDIRLSQGSYYVFVSAPYSHFGYGFFDRLYNGINCIGGLGIGCSLSQGQLIEVNNDTVNTLNITLKSKPRLTVTFKDKVSQKAIASRIKVYDVVGNLLIDMNNGLNHVHEINAIDPGEYYILGSAGLGYDAIGYPDIICDDIDSITSCEQTLQPIVLNNESDLTEINLQSMLNQGISGYVTKDSNEEVMADVIIDFWNDGGLHLGSTTTSGNGGFSYELSAGSYYISTDTGNEYMNEVYDNVFCDSAAILGNCDVTQGLLMSVPDNNVNPIQIDIGLSIDPIFTGDFE